jgi:hypothetical protein
MAFNLLRSLMRYIADLSPRPSQRCLNIKHLLKSSIFLERLPNLRTSVATRIDGENGQLQNPKPT